MAEKTYNLTITYDEDTDEVIEFKEYLDDNPDMKLLFNDYWKKIEKSKGGGTIPFDIDTALTLKPRM